MAAPQMSALEAYLITRPDPDDLARWLTLELFAQWQARAAYLGQVRSDGQLHRTGSFGFSDETVAGMSSLSLWDAMPMTRVLPSAEPLVLNRASHARAGYAWPEGSAWTRLGVLAASVPGDGSPAGSWLVLMDGDPPFKGEMARLAGDVSRALALVWSGESEVRGALRGTATRSGAGTGSGQLTDRQIAIVQLMGEGLTNNEIAERIGFSVSTVRQEGMAIFRFFGVGTRVEAVAAAQQAGLVGY